MWKWLRRLFGRVGPRLDIYQQDVEYLLAHPEGLSQAWENPRSTRGGSLFMTLEPDPPTYSAGCPTQVSLGLPACTPELARMIREDPLIPADKSDIGTSRPVLERFAHYQRECDKVAGYRCSHAERVS